MTTEAKKARREYYRKWRAENKDKVAAINHRYWTRQALKIKEAREKDEENKQ